MSSKSNLLLLILFTLTIGAVGWLGSVLISQQQQQLHLSQTQRLQQSLDLTQANINAHLLTVTQKLVSIAESNENQWLEELSSNPLIHGIYHYDTHNEESLFPLTLDITQQRAIQQWLTNLTFNDESLNLSSALHGWFSWHHEMKESFVFWLMKDQSVIFIDLNTAMFMAELIHFLSQQPLADQQSYLQITDSTGRNFYQWGNKELMTNADLNLMTQLGAPLNGWSLRQHSLLPVVSAYSRHLLLISIVSVLTVISILSFLLFKIKRREQKEASQRLSFINQVSHELKTPLTNIRLHGELLERTSDPLLEKSSSSVSSLAIIQQESERLTRLINNILNFNSLQKQSLNLHPTVISFASFLQQSIHPFEPTFSRLQIDIKITNDVNKEVCIDVDICQQILSNLLSNIEKYAADSEVIELNCTAFGRDIRIQVTDQGPGISVSLRDKVFQPFYRIHNTLTAASGSGLGLGLARDLARLHGGDLNLKACKKGACFEWIIKELDDA